MNQQGYTCPHCGERNPPAAEDCQSCGRSLSDYPTHTGASAPTGHPAASTLERLKKGVTQVFAKLTGQPTQTPAGTQRPGTVPLSPSAQQTAPPQSSARPSHLPTTDRNYPIVRHQPADPNWATPAPPAPQSKQPAGPRAPGRPLAPNSVFYNNRYQILTPRQLEKAFYYDAVALQCQNPQCQATYDHVPPEGFCNACNQPLTVVLIHEHHQAMQPGLKARILELGNAKHPRILPHKDILALPKATFTVLEHPGQWGVVVRGHRPRPIDDAVAIVVQVAQAFTFLHQQGFTYTQNNSLSWQLALENILILPGNEVVLADLSMIHSLPPNASQQATNVDIAFLGQLLLYLSTEVPTLPGDLDQAPASLYPVIEDSLQHKIPSVMAFIQKLHALSSAEPRPSRPLKPTHGQATHPGKRHPLNEDAIITFTYDKEQGAESVPIGFYLVADGMGGHEAGDLASRTVNEIVTDWILQTKVLPDLKKTTQKLTEESITEELLEDAIQKANDTLLQRGQAKGSNLGSTVTAALIIGNAVTIINVGDSRTYRLRKGELEQITQDHSLVARLVEAHVITPDEVRQHPRRNEIYRSLGQDPDVNVDTFTFSLMRGDRLILCCDGLWEMVKDDDIQDIVETSKTPQQACDSLIQAANQAGGEDNISVIIVEME